MQGGDRCRPGVVVVAMTPHGAAMAQVRSETRASARTHCPGVTSLVYLFFLRRPAFTDSQQRCIALVARVLSARLHVCVLTVHIKILTFIIFCVVLAQELM